MASNDMVYGNQLTLGGQHSKIIIACTVGGACLVFTAGLVFCLLVCRRWIHDKHRTRRQRHRRNRTPPAVYPSHGTLASSSGYHTTTSAGRRMSSSVTMLPDDISIPLPPDTSWRSSSVPSDVPLWWYQYPGNPSSSDAAQYGLSQQLSDDIASRVNTSHFTSPTAAAAVTSTQHRDVTAQHGQQKASSVDLYSLTSSGSAEQRIPVLADAPDVDRQASGRSETRLWRPSVVQPRRSTFDDHAATSAGEWSGSGVRPSVLKNVRSSARSGQRSADRKHSDCGLQRHQVNTSVVSPDRNTWELVTRTAPVLVRDSKSPVTNVPRTSGFRVRGNVESSDGDGNDALCDDNVWIRRFPPNDRNHIRPEQRHGCGQTSGRSVQNGHDVYSIEPSCNTVLSNLNEYRYGRSSTRS